MKNSGMFSCNFISNKMNVNLNMLSVLMLHWISRQINRTDIIIIHYSSLPSGERSPCKIF